MRHRGKNGNRIVDSGRIGNRPEADMRYLACIHQALARPIRAPATRGRDHDNACSGRIGNCISPTSVLLRGPPCSSCAPQINLVSQQKWQPPPQD